MVREGLSEEVTLEVRPEWKEGANLPEMKSFQAEGTTNAKALRQECVWGVGGRGEEGGEERGQKVSLRQVQGSPSNVRE